MVRNRLTPGAAASAAERYLSQLAARTQPSAGAGADNEPADTDRTVRTPMPEEINAREGLGAILQAGDALVAIGVIDGGAVERIAVDFVHAWERRGNPSLRTVLELRRWSPVSSVSPEEASSPAALRASTVVPGPIEVRLPWADITVRFVRFEPSRTVLAIRGRLPAASPSGARSDRVALGLVPPGSGSRVTITDDRDTSGEARFSGGLRAEDEIDGELTTAVPLSAESDYLDIDGVRMKLPTRRVATREVRVEQLATVVSPAAYLWHRVAIVGRPLGHAPPASLLGEPIAALVAVGAIDHDDPELDDVRRVAAALWNVPGTAPSEPLPPPWNSVVERRRRRSDGLSGTVPVEVVTPAVEGTSVCVHAIEAVAGRFVVEMEVAPDRPLAWWAEDDLGGVQLGYGEGLDGTPEHSYVRAVFLGGLDPGVEEVCFMPTGMRQRAVVRIRVGEQLKSTS